jgi:gag-polypeptide of LTR copia-type
MAAIDSELLKLEELSYTNTKSVQHLISALKKSKENLTALGAIFSDLYFVHILLKGLGPSYSSLIRDIRQREMKSIILDDCIAQAFTEEMSIKQNDRPVFQSTVSAMKTTNSKEKKTFECSKCGTGKHSSERCWILYPELMPKGAKTSSMTKSTVAEATAQFSSLQFDQLPPSVKAQFNHTPA